MSDDELAIKVFGEFNPSGNWHYAVRGYQDACRRAVAAVRETLRAEHHELLKIARDGVDRGLDDVDCARRERDQALAAMDAAAGRIAELEADRSLATEMYKAAKAELARVTAERDQLEKILRERLAVTGESLLRFPVERLELMDVTREEFLRQEEGQNPDAYPAIADAWDEMRKRDAIRPEERSVMDRPTCGTCACFEYVCDDPEQPFSDGPVVIGVCHLDPPKFILAAPSERDDCRHATNLEWSQPFVNGNKDWCSRHPLFPVYFASLKAAPRQSGTEEG